ncbi:MAG: cytochrome C oxidase Cbb3 [Desulfuromonadales bacterium GWC2_61_20]|nr:MAG: cytochrome C oxidase Cbb3 [Desulfuromonadales bacterium GWC2_61_20]HAD03849.1 cytochrome C oxidase Cbb3 [Desulfuromonas sp.]
MWEKRPVLLLILATAAILVGTVVTMVLPFVWVNTEADRIASVTPYTPLQQEGRDLYIREGCNNCHTQTVRPLVTEVLRYGDYSKSGEFVYDRPFLWGSKRTGPDLARLGGKYPDSWHYKHMDSPRSMVPRTNMPDYAWMKTNLLDPEMVRRKMQVLGFPYTEEQIKALVGKNEIDALVAYLQKLGSDIPWRVATQATMVGELKNPFVRDHQAMEEGREIYKKNCASCHGEHLDGDIAPPLNGLTQTDAALFETLYNGLPAGGMPGFASLGASKIWQVVSYLKYHDHEKGQH